MCREDVIDLHRDREEAQILEKWVNGMVKASEQ